MTQNEPGLELHEWETRWSELEGTLEEDPAGALPEACDAIEQILRERGVRTIPAGAEDELLTAYTAARDTADRVERGEDVDPGDLGAAVQNVRAVSEALRAGRGR